MFLKIEVRTLQIVSTQHIRWSAKSFSIIVNSYFHNYKLQIIDLMNNIYLWCWGIAQKVLSWEFNLNLQSQCILLNTIIIFEKTICRESWFYIQLDLLNLNFQTFIQLLKMFKWCQKYFLISIIVSDIWRSVWGVFRLFL